MRLFVCIVKIIISCVTSDVLGDLHYGHQAESAAAREEVEKIIEEKQLFADPISIEVVQQQAMLSPEEAKNLAIKGLTFIESELSEAHDSPSIATRTRVPISEPIAPSCQPGLKYRSFDGSCNNRQKTNWGRSFRAYNRLLPAQYADGISSPRVFSKDGSLLPSTRQISGTILGKRNAELKNVSVLFTFFGQFISHDLAQTPAASLVVKSGQTISCCQVAKNNLNHPDCFVIDIPADDAFYSQFNETCMHFARSLPAPPHEDSNGEVREQMNQLTAYLDGSQLYGSLEDQAQALRAKNSGKLSVFTDSPGHEFPPILNTKLCTADLKQQKYCFHAGDFRSSLTPQLTTLHVLFLREHNRVADELATLNPSWSPETVFQEARQIVIAKLQHITYNEFLPVVLGENLMRKYDLQIEKQGYWNKYDNNTDATVANEFTSAGFRYGHSNIPSVVQLYRGKQKTEKQRLRDHFMQPYEGKLFNDYVSGLSNQVSMLTDNEVSDELTDHLFQRGLKAFGMDLPALTMQRGRDHGIGTYLQVRTLCGLSDVNTFDDLKPFMYPGVVERMAAVYKHVDDIDLWIGAVSEVPVPPAVVGETYSCVIAEQFNRTRKGDRFWYERGGSEALFTQSQLEQIKLSSMARIICDNSDTLEIQPLAFLKESEDNSQVSCDSSKIPKTTVVPWKSTVE